jgi:hypothetical protein
MGGVTGPIPAPHPKESPSMLGVGHRFPQFALTGVVSNDAKSAFQPFTH